MCKGVGLLKRDFNNCAFSNSSLLGAGDGRVTMKMAPMFEEIYVTEISPVMRWRLRQANFT